MRDLHSMGMRAIRRGMVLASLVAALGLGCGQKYDLPPQPPPTSPPARGYNYFATWELGTATPIGIYQQDGLVYVADTLSTGEGRVRVYVTGLSVPVLYPYVSKFEGLTRPKLVTVIQRDSVFVFVADADTVKRFSGLGGAPLFKFSDPNWNGGIIGLAADNDLNTYVSYGNKIVAYDSSGRYHHLVADNRSGSGLVQQPAGIHCSGDELLVADQGTGLILRVRKDGTNLASHPAIDVPPMLRPSAVTADPQGKYIYVADTGNDRILKFRFSTGALVDSVYSPTKQNTQIPPPHDSVMSQPRFLAEADSSFVFVSDSDRRRIVVFQFFNQ